MRPHPTISKSQYIKGLQCPLALWFFRNRKDLRPEIDSATQMRFDAGHEVGALAQRYFSGGVKVAENYWDIQKAVQTTQQLVAEGYETIYEATALHPINGSYSRIDILRKISNKNSWDLLEAKSSTGKKSYHIDDVAFQYYVFTSAGYKINNCYLILLNNEYVRQGEIDPLSLFKLENITKEVHTKQDSIDVETTKLCSVVEEFDEPNVEIGSRCLKPFECEYRHHCWKQAPVFSIYDVFPASKADEVFAKTKSFDVGDIPSDMLPNGLKAIDVFCHKKNTEHVEKENIQEFLGVLKYPLYFLDYETLMNAVPLYDGTRPYQQIPFQFSLHIQEAAGASPLHFEFLHKDKTDPRPAFLENLLERCGTIGSILVYNQSFELKRNQELVNVFPEFKEEIKSIDSRVIDLMEPFCKRWMYKPEQLGSHSIKNVLPVYVPELTYGVMKIRKGEDAMNGYIRFVKGQLSENETKALWSDLSQYCKMDTYAMVQLLKVLRDRVV